MDRIAFLEIKHLAEELADLARNNHYFSKREFKSKEYHDGYIRALYDIKTELNRYVELNEKEQDK